MMFGGPAYGSPGAVWYAALQTLNNPTATFAQWAAETVKAATTLFGPGSRETRLTGRAWKLVGVL
jgi:Zn-dependent metalloprotease